MMSVRKITHDDIESAFKAKQTEKQLYRSGTRVRVTHRLAHRRIVGLIGERLQRIPDEFNALYLAPGYGEKHLYDPETDDYTYVEYHMVHDPRADKPRIVLADDIYLSEE